MLFSILALVVVAWLPGAALFRLPILDRAKRMALDAEERAFWAIVLGVACSSAVVLGLAAAGRYSFGGLLAVDLGVALAAVVGSRGRVFRREAGARRPTLAVLLPLFLVALGCWLFFPPFEHVIGGKDPGVYVNEGIQIAQRGSLLVHDAEVSSLPSYLRDLFFPFAPNVPYYCIRYMGFFVLDPAAGTVAGQFPHLYPAWIAIGYGLAGVRGALATTPVAAILGLLAVYFTGCRLLGRWPALVAASLLALNVATLWFAREPNSEIVTQVLLFGALLALARSQVDGDRFFAPVAAVLLGLALFLRFDVVLALGGFAVALGCQLLERRRPPALFLAPLAVLIVAAAAYYASPAMSGYIVRFLGFVSLRYPLVVAAGAASLACTAALVVISRTEAVASPVRRAIPLALAAAVLAAAGYAYFLRMPVGRLAWHDARSLEVFTWYFPPVALAAALAGYTLLAARSFSRAPALLSTVAVYGFFVFYKLQIVPEHFWVARRFIPVILPGACLMVGACASLSLGLVGRRAPRLRWAAAPLVVLLVAVIGAHLVRADVQRIGGDRAVMTHVEYAGLVARLDALASRFTDDDLLVVNPRDESDVHVLAVPLNYIWRRPTLVLPSPKPDKALFRQFLEWARRRYRNVYFLGGGGTDLVSRSIAADPVFGDRFQVPEYESLRNAYPRTVKRKEWDFGVYRFTEPGETTSRFQMDVGRLDDLNVYRFHAKERDSADGGSYRWSRNASYIALPRVDGARTLTLWLSDGGRPASEPPARVSVYLNARYLGSASVAHGFHPYAFTMVPGVATASIGADDAATVKIESTTWSPRRALGVADNRELGVMVRRVEIQ